MKIPSSTRQKFPVLLVAGLGGLFTVVNLASAQGWIKTSGAPRGWALASSADGSKLVAGGYPFGGSFEKNSRVPIYTSADAGVTWMQTSAPENVWTSVASSADGTKVVAVVGRTYDSNIGEYSGGPIYTSPDSGATWTKANAPSNHWTSVAASADGTKLVAVTGRTPWVEYIEGPIYTSPDAGATWTQTSAPATNWTSVASSADGPKLVAAVGQSYDNVWSYIGGRIYTSPDAGATWTQTGATQNDWWSVASSTDGTKLVAAAENGGIYSSTDSGVTWKMTSSLAAYWTSVASSADGNKLVALAYDGIYISPYLGPWRLTSTLELRDLSEYWHAIASSADGTKLVGIALVGNSISGPIYTSRDSGTTWTAATSVSDMWSSVASSADGSNLVVAAGGTSSNDGGPIYTSTNSGTTWRATSAPIEHWSSVASSADGTKVVAVVGGVYDINTGKSIGGPIYTSADSGSTWTQTTAPTTNRWYSVASSADGSKLVAAAGGIYRSTDSGATWALTIAPAFFKLVASSADGTKLVAAGLYEIYSSADSGATWTQITAPENGWFSLASSADGTKLLVAAEGIYRSTDSGVTWMPALAESWQAVASSADGSKLVAVANGSRIYTLQFPLPSPPLPQSPRLAISPSRGSMGLSWLVPSTTFVLQQNSDLSSTNWTNTPTAATLNFTNLNNQVTVSPSLGSRFYRLKQQ